MKKSNLLSNLVLVIISYLCFVTNSSLFYFMAEGWGLFGHLFGACYMYVIILIVPFTITQTIQHGLNEEDEQVFNQLISKTEHRLKIGIGGLIFMYNLFVHGLINYKDYSEVIYR